MTFLSYRDPNLAETLKTYDGTAQYLTDAEIAPEEVLQAVVGAVGDLDAPLQPDQKGFMSMTQYLAGETAANRQKVNSMPLSRYFV